MGPSRTIGCSVRVDPVVSARGVRADLESLDKRLLEDREGRVGPVVAGDQAQVSVDPEAQGAGDDSEAALVVEDSPAVAEVAQEPV